MEELEKKIEYQFIPAPLNLFHICDIYTYSLLLTLIQKESYWKLKDKLSDGFFYISIEEIGDIILLDNRNDIRCTIEALYTNGIIDVRCKGIGRGSKNKIANEFKINYDKIKEFDEMSIFDIKEFDVRIEKLKRGSKVTYDKKQDLKDDEPCKKVNTKHSVQDSIQHSVQDSVQIVSKVVSKVVPTTIYNIEEKEKIENLNKIDNIDSNISNIVEIEKTIDINELFPEIPIETEDKIEMNETVDMLFDDTSIDSNTSNGTADADTSSNIENKAHIPILNKDITDSSIKEISFNTECLNSADAITPIENKSNETINNNDMMKEEDKKTIIQQKIESKMLSDDEKKAILNYLFDNMKTISKEDAIKTLKDYQFSKKEIDFVKECYANQYSYAS